MPTPHSYQAKVVMFMAACRISKIGFSGRHQEMQLTENRLKRSLELSAAKVRNPPKETAVALALKLPLICASPRATTPPSGVFVRFDSGRIRLNCGAIHFWQAHEMTCIFECVSIWVKGG